MGNGYDIWEVEGKRESRGMWMGFVPPMSLPHKRMGIPTVGLPRHSITFVPQLG